jgi:Flp pilus assembly protein TadG
MQRPKNIWRRFRGDRSGAVAITFAIAAIPIVVAMGSAIDYSLMNKAKGQLDGYADAAVLDALAPNAIGMPALMAEAKAKQFFTAQAVNVKRIKSGKVSAKVIDELSGRTVVIAYEATVATTFMGLVSINSVDLKGTSAAHKALPVSQNPAGPIPSFKNYARVTTTRRASPPAFLLK